MQFHISEERKDVEAALSNLSYNKYGELVYTQCNLTNHNLSNLSLIAGYSFIQRLLLDDNHLCSLSYLEHLPNLVFLSASRNNLSSMAFKEIAKACADTIEWLDVSENGIDELIGVSQLSFLVHLDVSYNKIRAIEREDVKEMCVLRYLNISHNNIKNIAQDAFTTNTQLCELLCSSNEVKNMNFVSSFTDNIRTCDLSNNKIENIPEYINKMTRLMELNLSFNTIAHVDSLTPLTLLTSLRSIYIYGNPVCNDNNVNDSNINKSINFKVSEKASASLRYNSLRERIELTQEEVLYEANELAECKKASAIENNKVLVCEQKTFEPCKQSNLQRIRGSAIIHKIAALSAAPVYGVVRRVLPHRRTYEMCDDGSNVYDEYTYEEQQQQQEQKGESVTGSLQKQSSSNCCKKQATTRLKSSTKMIITWLIHHIPSLTEIDGWPITPEQRARAQRYREAEHTEVCS